MRINRQQCVFFCCAVVATSIAAQSPETMRAPEKPKVSTELKTEQKAKRGEAAPTTSMKQSPQEKEDGPWPMKSLYPSQQIDDSAFAKRDVAQRTLVVLHSAIQSAVNSGIDGATIKIREDELWTQLMDAKRDSDFDEVTSRAATLLAEVTRDVSKLPNQRKTGTSATDPARGGMLQLDSFRGNTPLIVSIVSLIISIFAVIVGPWFSREASRKAIAKALRSAGLK